MVLNHLIIFSKYQESSSKFKIFLFKDLIAIGVNRVQDRGEIRAFAAVFIDFDSLFSGWKGVLFFTFEQFFAFEGFLGAAVRGVSRDEHAFDWTSVQFIVLLFGVFNHLKWVLLWFFMGCIGWFAQNGRDFEEMFVIRAGNLIRIFKGFRLVIRHTFAETESFRKTNLID